MRKQFHLALLLLILNTSLAADTRLHQSTATQQSQKTEDQKIIDLPVGPQTFKPKLTLQEALKIAERYIDKERIEISSYWLYQAKFSLYGDQKVPDKDKIPCWRFWWAKNNGAMGDFVDIVVFMDGKAVRLPTM